MSAMGFMANMRSEVPIRFERPCLCIVRAVSPRKMKEGSALAQIDCFPLLEERPRP